MSDGLRETDEDVLARLGHPRGTLAVVVIFGVLFALAWFAAYATFIARGATHH
jgi:hypothetical protein